MYGEINHKKKKTSKLLCGHVRESLTRADCILEIYWNRLRNWGTCHGQEQTALLNLVGYIQTHCTMI